ncbi:MAG TPA: benzoate-CoA ligase family protein [Terriglobales bacterium]|nr:benzoate-CoA ligase family protein [Terriglobales bacterium]
MIVLPEIFNTASYFVDRNVLEGRGQKTAIECGDQRISYKQLQQQINRVGNALRRLGVRREERVHLLLVDGPEFLFCFFGAIKIGAVAVPTNPYLKASDYEYLLNQSRARVVILSEQVLPQFQEIPPARLRYVEDVVVVGSPGDSYQSFHNLIAQESAELEAEPTHRDDAAFWLFSSGSTGFPKGCVHLQHDMVVSSDRYAKGILGITENDRCYSVARLFFAYGLGNAGYFPLYVGATTILSPLRPTPAGIYADIERYRPTLFYSVPTNYAALLNHLPDRQSDFDLSSIRHAISAGEALPAPIFHRFKQRFGIEILDSLGSTEALQMVIANRPGEVKPGSSGKIIPGFEAKIVDEAGQPVAAGEIGNLLIKADSTCAFYWNDHEKTKRTFIGPWFYTGDKYFQDEDGYFWYAGRSDDLFKVNGKWVSPTEVESALLDHSAIQEAAVVAREDDDGLAKPAAFVVIKPEYQPNGELSAELKTWVADRLGGYKQPRWIEYLAALPKTATGKLQRFKLRQYQAERRGHDSDGQCASAALGDSD